MIASIGILKVLPLQTFGLASSKQAWRMQKTLFSASATRTSQPATGKPPATPFNQHEAEPPRNPFGQPKYVSKGKLPSNYNATARRVLTIMVGLPVFIVTSYVLFERVFWGKEQKILVPRLEKEKQLAANNDIPWDSPNNDISWDSPVAQPDKYHDSNEENLR